jgi:hypothetical protein
VTDVTTFVLSAAIVAGIVLLASVVERQRAPKGYRAAP